VRLLPSITIRYSPYQLDLSKISPSNSVSDAELALPDRKAQILDFWACRYDLNPLGAPINGRDFENFALCERSAIEGEGLT
jgi:hypothetical protein